MKEFSPSDLLLYGLIFLGLLVFNYFMQQAARRRQQEEQQEQLKEEEPPAPDEPLPSVWGRRAGAPAASPSPAAPVERVRGPDVLAAAAAPPRRRAGAKSLFATRRDLRRAVVLMTVLGPCRSQEPPAGR